MQVSESSHRPHRREPECYLIFMQVLHATTIFKDPSEQTLSSEAHASPNDLHPGEETVPALYPSLPGGATSHLVRPCCSVHGCEASCQKRLGTSVHHSSRIGPGRMVTRNGDGELCLSDYGSSSIGM